MNGRKLTAAQQARVAHQREERVKELQEQLQHGVAALMTSDGWQTWLSFISRFRQYSVRNQILIMAQKPDATQVAGYRAWQAAGRQVRRGEKAISVLGPLTRKLLDDAGNPVLDDAGNPRLGIYGFRPMPVFDVTQTDGPDVPQSPPQESTVLQGAAPEGMWHDLARYIESHGFTVASTPDLGGPEGLTRFDTLQVLVLDSFPPAHAAAVLAHEAGHVVMHQPAAGNGQQCRGVVEVEAESFAHVVAADYGLDASSASFGYLAGWAASAAQQRQCTPEDVVLETAERVRRAIVDHLTHRNPEGTTSAAVVAYARLHRSVEGLISPAHPPPPVRAPVQHSVQNLTKRPSLTAMRQRISP